MFAEQYKKNKSTYFIVTAVLIAVYSFLAWHKVLDYWFFKAFEPQWLNMVGQEYKSWVQLYKNHSYVAYLNYLLFGWNAKYWYLTSILIHTLASFSFGWFIYQCLRFFISSFHAYVLTTTAVFLFVASFVYHDVVTWGSFNAYYGLLFILFSTSLSCFVLFRKKNIVTYLLLSVLIFFTAIFVRETAILIIPLIFLIQVFIIPSAADSFFYKIKKGILITIPYLIAACIFLYIRHELAGVSGDFADENVKLRLALIANNEYFELLRRILLTLWRNLITLFVPYTWLNGLKAGLIENYPNSIFIRRYLYCCFGLLACIFLSWHALFVYRKREQIKLWPFYLFGLGWVFLFLMFLGLAVPSTNSVLESPYDWNTRRYNYFPFIGLLFIFIFWINTIYEFLSKKWNSQTALTILTTICLSYTIFNLYILFGIQTTLYREVHKPSKDFFQDFVAQYPQLTNDTYFYYHPHSVGLNDFLAELGLTFSYYYPGQKDMYLRNETQISQILKKVSEGKISLEQLVLLGYSPKTGLIDKTRDVISFVKEHKIFSFKDTSHVELDESTFLPIEMPYIVDVTLKRNNSNNISSGKRVSSFIWFMENASVSARSTLSQRVGEPYDFCSAELLIDGNFDDRQSWCADGQNNDIYITLPKSIPISGLWWITKEPNLVMSTYRVISTYNVQYWEDEQWKIIHEVKGNRKLERKDIFEQEISTQKLRLRIISSITGAAPLIKELGIIVPETLDLFKSSKDLSEILKDNLQSARDRKSFIKFEWETSLGEEKVDKNSYNVLVDFGAKTPTFSFELPESEHFAFDVKYFFAKRISNLSIIIPEQLKHLFSVSEITVTPKYKI